MSTLVAFVSNSFDATSAGNGNRCGRTRRPDIRPCLAAREDFRNWLIGEAPGSRNSSMRQDDSHCDGSLNGSVNVLMPARSADVCLSGTVAARSEPRATAIAVAKPLTVVITLRSSPSAASASSTHP